MIATNSIPDAMSIEGKDLTYKVLSLLERRYLSSLEIEHLSLKEEQTPDTPVLLREITEIGREADREEIRSVMPNILQACQDQGHTLMMILHGEEKSQHVFFGGRRLPGRAKGSTMSYINRLESALKTYYNGLKMGEVQKLDTISGLHNLLSSAPCMSVITGVPSDKKMISTENLQGLDRLARAAGSGQYAVICIAEPVHPIQVDLLLDRLRQLKSEVHSLVRTSISTSTSGSETKGYSKEIIDNKEKKEGKMLSEVGSFLTYFSLATPVAPVLGLIGIAASMAGAQKLEEAENKPHISQQFSESSGWGTSESRETLNAHAAFCESLIDEHIDRLQRAKSRGWWNMGLYILAESEFVLSNLEGAVKSLCSGENSALDPVRAHRIPSYLLRDSAINGKLLSFELVRHIHPLGPLYSNLSTCINSQELATLIHLPINEIPGIRFRRHAEYSLTVPENKHGNPDILLGSLYSAGKSLLDVRLTLEALNRHLFVTGMSGYGKTNTCMQILFECYTKHQIPFLVIDPVKTDYRNFLQLSGVSTNLRIFTIGATTPLPLKLNPFELMPFELLQRNPGYLSKHIDLLKAVFNASFPGMKGGPLSYVLEDAIIEAYQRKGWNIYNSLNTHYSATGSRDDWYELMPTLSDLPAIIDSVMKKKNYGTETTKEFQAALQTRINSLMQNNKGAVLNVSRSVPFADLFDSPCIIEIKDLGDNYDKSFVMALLFTFLYEYSELKRGESSQLRHLTLIEEAHRLLSSSSEGGSPDYGNPQAKAVATFTEMIAEMRGYGEGFLIADQSPTALNPNTIKNTNIKIIHRLAFPDDRRLSGDSVNLTTEQKNYLNSLDRGFAVFHEDRLEEALLLKIVDLKGDKFSDKLEQYQWEYLFKGMSERVKHRSKAYLFRHSGCTNCDNPCTYFYESNITKDFDGKIERFALYITANDQKAAFEEFKSWQSAHPDALTGYLYCVAVNQLNVWIEKYLNARVLAVTGTDLTTQQLLKSKFLQAFARILPIICNEPEWKEELVELISLKKFMEQYFSSPPFELTGCDSCAARCLFKSPVKLLLQDEKKKNHILASLKMNKSILEFAPYVSHIPQKNWEYCLQVHLKNGQAI